MVGDGRFQGIIAQVILEPFVAGRETQLAALQKRGEERRGVRVSPAQLRLHVHLSAQLADGQIVGQATGADIGLINHTTSASVKDGIDINIGRSAHHQTKPPHVALTALLGRLRDEGFDVDQATLMELPLQITCSPEVLERLDREDSG